jgi:hypothetical protein
LSCASLLRCLLGHAIPSLATTVFLRVSVVCWSQSALPIPVLLCGRGFTVPLIFSLGPYADPLLAPVSVTHAEAGGNGSVGFFRCENSSGDSFDRFCL